MHLHQIWTRHQGRAVRAQDTVFHTPPARRFAATHSHQEIALPAAPLPCSRRDTAATWTPRKRAAAAPVRAPTATLFCRQPAPGRATATVASGAPNVLSPHGDRRAGGVGTSGRRAPQRHLNPTATWATCVTCSPTHPRRGQLTTRADTTHRWGNVCSRPTPDRRMRHVQPPPTKTLSFKSSRQLHVNNI